MSERTLFGTDGVRGVANVEPMTTETAMRLGRAIAVLVGQHGGRGGHRRRIVIGKDTRLSGYMFEQALAAGICSMGADVLLSGPLPTPGIAFLTSSMRADAGVVISASHNAYEDNGIKIFSRDGFKLPDQTELAIERLVNHPDELDGLRPAADAIGKASRIDDAVGRYVVFLKSTFPKERTLDGLRIVVDCANGAGYKVAPKVFAELGADVTALSVRPDGRNINAKCGALHPEALGRSVRKHHAHLGVALDGDADRVIFTDEQGEVVDGDVIMALCATRMLARGQLKHRTVVATVMSNLGLERALAQRGARLLRTQVGDRYVVEEMRRGDYNFGGEQSGHLVFLDHMTTGDGIVAALAVLALLVEEDKPLSELTTVMTRYPQVLVNVRVRAKRPIEELAPVRRLIQRVEGLLGQQGRVLVRYSGTELKARVMVEGPDADVIRGYADEIAHELIQACDAAA